MKRKRSGRHGSLYGYDPVGTARRTHIAEESARRGRAIVRDAREAGMTVKGKVAYDWNLDDR